MGQILTQPSMSLYFDGGLSVGRDTTSARLGLPCRENRILSECLVGLARRWGTLGKSEQKSRIMKIAVVGTGYVGLVQGTCLAESGNDVVCVDKIAAKVEGLRRGQVPIYEPGLGELVHRNLRDGRLAFTTDLADGMAEAEIVFIAVGTPQGESGGADLSGVWEVGRQIAANLGSPKVIVIKSTVPVGTNAELARRMVEATDVPFDVASNPEFLKEGAAIDDFNKPDRIVVGVRKPEVAERLHTLYAPFLRTDRPFLVMTPESTR